MGDLNLVSLTKEHPYIQKIKKALEQATGQTIVHIDVRKVKRVAGASVVPLQLDFEGDQELILFVRASADVFKAKLNDKDIVLSGDFSDAYKPTFDAAVTGVAKLVRQSQPKTQAENAKQKVKLPPRRSASISQQIMDKSAEEQALEKTIADKTAQRDELLARLEQAKAQTSSM